MIVHIFAKRRQIILDKKGKQCYNPLENDSLAENGFMTDWKKRGKHG